MKKSMLASLLLIPALVAGCSTGSGGGGTKPAGNSSSPSKSVTHDPVTLTFASDLGMSPDDFQKNVADPVHQKFPWITLNYIERGKGKMIEDLVSAGTVPDIYWYVYNRFPTKIQKLGLDFDMSELIKQNKFDTTHIDPTAMKALDQFTGGTGVYGLPFVSSTSVMYYNKAIFDKFGTAYPKDGMTWDQTYELAKKLTRSEGGVKYRGFASFYSYLLRENPYGLSPIDPKAGKASLNTDGWKKIYENLIRFYQIPGNERSKDGKTNSENQAFYKDQNIAMTVLNNDLNNPEAFPKEMSWDVVSMPVYPDKPKIADQASPWEYSILKTSKHKDDAFTVLSYLCSDEFFMRESKRGVRTPTTSDAIKKAFASDSDLFKGKNIGAFYYYPSAPSPTGVSNPTVMSTIMSAQGEEGTVFNNVILKGEDLNTALREGDDAINKMISDAQSGK